MVSGFTQIRGIVISNGACPDMCPRTPDRDVNQGRGHERLSYRWWSELFREAEGVAL